MKKWENDGLGYQVHFKTELGLSLMRYGIAGARDEIQGKVFAAKEPTVTGSVGNRRGLDEMQGGGAGAAAAGARNVRQPMVSLAPQQQAKAKRRRSTGNIEAMEMLTGKSASLTAMQPLPFQPRKVGRPTKDTTLEKVKGMLVSRSKLGKQGPSVVARLARRKPPLPKRGWCKPCRQKARPITEKERSSGKFPASTTRVVRSREKHGKMVPLPKPGQVCTCCFEFFCSQACFDVFDHSKGECRFTVRQVTKRL